MTSVVNFMVRNRCPYYEDVPVKGCNAVLEGIKVPSEREINWFCLGGHYEECSIYINKERLLSFEKSEL